MVDMKTGRAINQEDWKRTQIRMPHEDYEKVLTYAEKFKLSLNTAMVDLINIGLGQDKPQSRSSKAVVNESNVRMFKLDNGIRRVVYGKFIDSLDLDYTQDLKTLRADIEIALYALQHSSLTKRLAFLNKDVLVYMGGHHIDVVDNGKRSLNWLVVEDHEPIIDIDDE